MTSYTEREILAALDEAQAGECWEWPDFGHPDYDTLTAPMVVLRDAKRWAIVFCTVEWDTDHALTATVMPVGNCVKIPAPENYQQSPEDYAGPGLGKREIERQMKLQADYMARRLDSVRFDFDFGDAALADRGFIRAVRVRGKKVDLSRLEIKPDGSRDAAFAVALAVLKQYRNRILPHAAEAARFFPRGMPPVFMVIGEWHHSQRVRPSRTEVFRQLARALVENDPARYAPTEAPNTEWRIGAERDGEAGSEEEDEAAGAEPAEQAFIPEDLPAPDEAERKIIDDIIIAYQARTLSTEPVDRESCMAAFVALYATARQSLPEFIFCSSPRDFMERALIMLGDGQRVEDVVGDMLYAGLRVNLERDHPDAKRQAGIVRYVGERTRPFHDVAECVHRALWACIPKARQFDMPMCSTTARLMDDAVAWEAAEVLGLEGDRRAALLRARAAFTCVAYGTYERYCFIIDRPSRIVHPALTPGAPKGRCRVEWRDGYSFEQDLNA